MDIKYVSISFLSLDFFLLSQFYYSTFFLICLSLLLFINRYINTVTINFYYLSICQCIINFSNKYFINLFLLLLFANKIVLGKVAAEERLKKRVKQTH